MSFITFVQSGKNVPKEQSSRFGIRVGDVGIDFAFEKERQKLLELLSKASSVKINNSAGVVYKKCQVNFGIYERNMAIEGIRCNKCESVYYNGECRKQEYEYPYSYGDSGLSSTTDFICDKCLSSLKEQVAEIKRKNVEEKEKVGAE